MRLFRKYHRAGLKSAYSEKEIAMAKFTVRIILLDDQGRTKRIIQGEKDFDGKCPEKGEVVEFKDFVSWLLPTILCVDLEKGTLSATTKFPRLITALMLNQPKIWTETAV